MIYNPKRSIELLRIGSNDEFATFRHGQEDAIKALVEGKTARLLVVQKTGWGKSFVYFISTKLLREGGYGPTILISPLLSLMRNQVTAATRMGLVARTANSSNKEEWPSIIEDISSGQLDVLLFHPKQLANPDFNAKLLGPIAEHISFMVVDEAHCISDWGHDFVPEYRLIQRTIQKLPRTLRLLATTATANKRVMSDLNEILGNNIQISTGDLSRPSLTLQTISFAKEENRLAWLAEQLMKLPGNGIIYALTKSHVSRIVAWLKLFGISVEGYAADSPNREELEEMLLNNRVKALVSTSALGMGYDKPDVAFVIHYQIPGSVVSYYQQVGRAGRSIPAAYGILLAVPNEPDINSYFINNAFPSRKDVHDVLEAIDASGDDGASVNYLLQSLNMSRGNIEKTLNMLALENPSPIVLDQKRWLLTSAQLSEEFWVRAERVKAVKKSELREMEKYVSLRDGHMEYLISALDGDPTLVSNNTLPFLSANVSQFYVDAAKDFLRKTNIPITPRKQWPAGGLTIFQAKGNIPLNERAEEGRALSTWGDAGWGALVQHDRYIAEILSDTLVQACAKMITSWNLEPYPTWVTCIPSLNNPRIVPDFAKKLANALDLPFLESLQKVKHSHPQKFMANSNKQAGNLDGSMNFINGATGPVFLVDDIMNSGWTFTIGAWILRKNGCGPVFPVCLAKTGSE